MRFKSFLLVAVVALGVVIGQAAPKTLDVLRVPNVPVVVRASLGRGATTWFYGKAPRELSKRPIWIHFYSIPTRRTLPKPNLDSNGDDLVNPRDYVLSLWEQSGTARRAKYRRVNSLELSGARFLNSYNGYLDERNKEFVKINSYLSWLRDSTKQTPIIRLQIVLASSFNADISRDDLLFVFRDGLLKRPHLQQFDTHYELNERVVHTYDQTDEQGILIINKESEVRVSSDIPGAITKSEFHWNGREFVEGEIIVSPSVYQ